jgi:transposase
VALSRTHDHHSIVIMPFHRISQDFKAQAMELFEQGMLLEDVCDVLGVSKSSIYRWRENLEVYGDVVPDHSPIQGWPRILDPRQVHDLVELVQQVPEMYLDEIQDWLAVTHDIGLSLPAIHQLLST